jgi:hypothetical protein
MLAQGKLFFYSASSFSTPQPTYISSAGSTPNANPIILDSTGRVDTEIWIDSTINYNIVLTLPDSTTVLNSWNNISLANLIGGSGGAVVTSLVAGPGISVSSATGTVTIGNTATEWITAPTLPTYISGTSFSVTGNQTGFYNIGRRVKATVTAGVVYGTIVSSVSTSLTTITLTMDGSQALDSGLVAAVGVGIVSGVNTSAPVVFGATPITLGSAATVNIGGAPTTTVYITGTTAITAFDTVNAGILRYVGFNGILVLTYNATSMQLPGNVNITTAAGDSALFESLGSGNWKCINYFPQAGYLAANVLNPSSKLFPITASVASNALTMGLNPCTFDFAALGLQVGVPTTVTVSTALTLVAPTAATLGSANGLSNRLVLAAIYYGGAVELAVASLDGSLPMDELIPINTTTLSGASTAATMWYSATGRTGCPWKIVGIIDITEATAGTYATAPTLIRGVGGNTQVNTIPEIITVAYTGNTVDSGTITRSHVGPIQITYTSTVNQGGLNNLGWQYFFNGTQINGWGPGLVNYMLSFSPTWTQVYQANGSFTFRMLLTAPGGTGFGQGQFTITYL